MRGSSKLSSLQTCHAQGGIQPPDCYAPKGLMPAPTNSRITHTRFQVGDCFPTDPVEGRELCSAGRICTGQHHTGNANTEKITIGANPPAHRTGPFFGSASTDQTGRGENDFLTAHAYLKTSTNSSSGTHNILRYGWNNRCCHTTSN